MVSPALASTYSERVLSHSPLAYWRLGETSGSTVADSANSNNGSYVNGVTLNQSGAIIDDTNPSARFDGSNDRVTLGTLSISGGDMTILAWFRADDFDNINGRIISKASTSAEANTYWMLSTGDSGGLTRLRFRVRTDGVTTTLVASSGNLSANTWYFAAAVYTGSQMRLYLNGQLVGSVSKTGTLNTSSSVNTWIGECPDSTNQFDGFIDEVAVYSTALTQDEINELYVDSGRALVGHWKLEEATGQTVGDSSTYAHNGTRGATSSSESSDPTWTTGKVGSSALSFDGTDDRVTVAHTSNLSITDEVTIAAWVRPTVLSGYQLLASKGTSGTNYNYWLGTLNNNITFGFYNGAYREFNTTTLNLQTGAWYHLAATYSNTSDRVRVYLNGALVQSWTTTQSLTANSEALFIGRSPAGEYWNGVLDDVRLYNRELAASQIALVGSLALVGHWKLDETSGTTASDMSGKANHGTLTGLSFTTESRNGRDGTGLDFQGNDYISVANNSSLQITTGITITAWIKGDAWGSSSDVNTIVRKGTDNPNNYQLCVADSKIALMLDDSDTGGGVRGNTTLATGQWHHVAATWDGSYVRIYLNGVLDMSSPTARSGTIGTDTRSLYIGGRASSDYFDGIIDDVRLYNYALSAAEIREVYGTLGYWKFDETSPATTAADSSGNGYSAPRSGNTAWATGRVNGAAYFDGSGDYATTSSSFATPPDGTITFWMKSAALAGTQRILGNGGDWEIRQIASGVVAFDIAGDTRFQTAALQANKWYHIAAMFDDTNDKYALYVNGSLYASGTQTFTPQSAAAMSFGTRTGSTEYWNGTLDEVYIYNRRMTATEVQELYNGAPALGVHILKWNEVQ